MSLIIVEGNTDIDFIKCYFKYLFNRDLKDKNIKQSGGRNKILQCEADIKRAIERDERVLIIFDADDNFQKSKDNILKQLEELNLTSINGENIFLFPNNKGNGNLETLLENIVLDENKCIINCFDNYCECIKKIKNNDDRVQLPAKKTKVFTYMSAFGFKNGIDPKKFDITPYIDTSSEYLEPLKIFLESNINDEE